MKQKPHAEEDIEIPADSVSGRALFRLSRGFCRVVACRVISSLSLALRARRLGSAGRAVEHEGDHRRAGGAAKRATWSRIAAINCGSAPGPGPRRRMWDWNADPSALNPYVMYQVNKRTLLPVFYQQ